MNESWKLYFGLNLLSSGKKNLRQLRVRIVPKSVEPHQRNT
jgi:hypothetical protein